jgi:hypothetical protein
MHLEIFPALGTRGGITIDKVCLVSGSRNRSSTK